MKSDTMPVGGGGIQLNVKASVIAFVLGVIFIYLVYSWTTRNSDTGSGAGQLSQFHTWKTMNEVEIPKNIRDAASNVKIKERHLTFEFDGKKSDIFLREVSPVSESSKVQILMLHGAKFTSNDWVTLGTLQLLASMGHRTIAIDLPGWGQSLGYGEVSDKGGFLAKFIKQEKLDRPVIISPSMSGQFSVPYIMGDKPIECTDRVRGFVPVAPVATETFTHAQWHRCETPTMIVYGTEDKNLGLIANGNLRNMPNSEIFPLEKARHPAYLDKPDDWHKHLYNFLLAVDREAV